MLIEVLDAPGTRTGPSLPNVMDRPNRLLNDSHNVIPDGSNTSGNKGDEANHLIDSRS